MGAGADVMTQREEMRMSTWHRGYNDGFDCRTPEPDDHLIYWDGWRRGAIDGLVQRNAMAKQEVRRVVDADLFLVPP